MRFRYSAEENGRPVKKASVFTQDEHRINFSDVDPQAVYIVERLQANGYETYIVGGAVRDLILGKKPKDFDIVTSANPARIKKIFRNARIIGRRFRLVHVFFGPKIFEISTFRSIKDGPTGNIFGTIEEDVQRRDFTLNALFYDPLKQLVIDYVDGMKDIKKRVIRPIIAMNDIFTDDPVRMIRAVKYAAASGFSLPFFLKLKIRKQSCLLAEVSPSRLTEEILKVIHSPCAREIVEALDTMKLYEYMQPGAVGFFKAKPSFRAGYLSTMGKLNREGFKNLPGEALSALIRDYCEETVDWDGSPENARAETQGSPAPVPSAAERYKNAFGMVRQFVLPMNPPKVELDSALRLLFAEHGIAVKRLRFGERRPRPSGPAEALREKKRTLSKIAGSPPVNEGAASEDAPAVKKRRRRRRGNTGTSSPAP